ncbi:MAG TPA: FUSC family protein [Thermoanaerobaculia bacterium]|nr:FUSC family protein [Thermoanaerobaculia bacterium]
MSAATAAEKQRAPWLEPVRRDIVGVRFAVNVFIASAIVWYALRHIADTNPIWAIASMVASSEPVVKEAARMFRSRLINVLIGCVVGLSFLMVGGAKEWKLPLALAVTVLVSSYVIHVQTMWRQAPITAAIVIASGVEHNSKLSGIEHGLHKVGEVLFGCFVGLGVSWLMSKVWTLKVGKAEA